MKYRIIYDNGERIRLRCGQNTFTREQGYGIAAGLRRITGVETVYTNPINGSILISHFGKSRQRILDYVATLDVNGLPQDDCHESQASWQITQSFKDQIISKILTRIFVRLFVPSTVRAILSILKAKDFIANGLKALKNGNLNVDVLDAASVTAAMIQGDFINAASIMFLLDISEDLSEYTKEKARDALKHSIVLNLDWIWKKEGDTEIRIPISKLDNGDIVITRTGAMIPVDGTVTDGYGTVNEAAMTGESMAVEKRVGATVYAGTVMSEGTLYIQVKALPQETRLQQIINLVKRSEMLKAEIQSNAERLADAIVPFSFLSFFGVLLYTQKLNQALSVLMVDYSCAIKLATPISIMAAMKEAATHDIFVKGGKHLEQFANADTLVFDKTGTLTAAVPKVTKIIPLDDMTADGVLRIAACLEEHFPHPVAKAIVAEADRKGLCHPEDHTEVEYVVAHGIVSAYNGLRTIVGSAHFIFEDEGVILSEAQQTVLNDELQHRSPIYVAMDGKLIGVICIEDPPRPEAKAVIAELRDLGFKHIIMLTGDNASSAKSVCKTLGIDTFYAEVLPEDKSQIVSDMKDKGHRIVMVGDGINDSPALAMANVSVAMKDASDLAKESADILLQSSHLEGLATLRHLSRKLLSRIKSNYRRIVVFNTGLLVLGIARTITPATSAWLHNTSTIAIGAYSGTPLLPKAKLLPEPTKIVQA